MIILGINAYHGDSSACIVVVGKLIAAAEEERFTRIKHWAGLPTNAIKYCLDEAKVSIEDIDHIAINRDPKANIMKKALFAYSKRPSLVLEPISKTPCTFSWGLVQCPHGTKRRVIRYPMVNHRTPYTQSTYTIRRQGPSTA